MKTPPDQNCNAHGPYKAWRPVCPDCRREAEQLEGRRQETVDRLEPGAPVPYGEFPDGF